MDFAKIKFYEPLICIFERDRLMHVLQEAEKSDPAIMRVLYFDPQQDRDDSICLHGGGDPDAR